MTNFCNHCGTCCKLIPANIEKQLLYRDGIQTLDEDFISLLEPLTLEEACNINESYVNKVHSLFSEANFYKCKNLSQDNLCISLDKHDFCKTFPCDALALIPDECGYYGEIFIKHEELKQKVRKYKEEIIYYESMIASGCKEEKVYLKIIDSLNKFIEKYIPFGANDW